LRRFKGTELRHIGAGGERLISGSGQHQHLDRAVRISRLANFGQPFVHRERHSVPRVRAIEGDATDAVGHGVKQIFIGSGHGHCVVVGVAR
jgi:hypothetical protein